VRSIARKFGVKEESLRRHNHKHVSDAYRASVRIGPFKSEEELRKLLAENTSSVVENLHSIYGGLANRWLVNFENGDDDVLVSLTKAMHRNLEMRAQISRELSPGPSTVINNVFALPIFTDLQRTLLETLQQYPEARAAVIRALRDLEAKSPPLLEVAVTPAGAAA